MFKKILVATDGSTHSEKAAKTAVELAKQSGAKLVAIAVSEPYPLPPISESPYSGGSAAYEQHSLALAQEHAAQVAKIAAAEQVPCETVVVSGLNPHDEILAACAKLQCDSIVMATHGRKGLSKLFAGSETQKVIANAHVPVVVIR
jgi:nucleotide-binding universal stress UspA family protein